jgi:hypothetical protein
VPRRSASNDWPDFTGSARLQFWSLPDEVIEQFAAVFPELTRSPLRPSSTLDICPIRNDPNRWRLKDAGFRALYSVRHGWPVIEHILPRTDRTYQEFESHRRRHAPNV